MTRTLLRLVALFGPVGLIAWQILTLPPLLPRQANGSDPGAGKQRTLGQILADIHLNTDEDLRKNPP